SRCAPPGDNGELVNLPPPWWGRVGERGMSRYRVSMDIGGTFTDFVVADRRDRRSFTGKALTTPRDPSQGVLTGLRDLIPDPQEIEFSVHGTTVGLNAFLERRGT